MSAASGGPFISIVVPVHNQTGLLKKLLRSIWEEGLRADSYEVVVVDDGSAEPVATARLNDGAPPGVTLHLLRHDTAHGAAAARNTGNGAATGEVLLFLDADTILEKGALRRVHERFTSEPSLGALNGGGAADPANPEDGYTPKYRAMIDHVQQNRRAPRQCSFFTPRLGAVRKKFFDACGRFDPSFPGASVEEYEFGHRLVQQCPILFDPEINVLHHYQKFMKNNRNFFVRVRLWMPIFWKRRKFENFGSVTGSYGVGSVFGAAAAAVLPFVCTGWPATIAFLTAFGLFLWGYAELFVWTWRIKGLVFLVQSILLSWWLCLFITAGALAGTVDSFLGGSGRRTASS